MREKLTYRISAKEDRVSIAKLLSEQGLPVDDIMDEKIEFIISLDTDNNLVGCIGLEQIDEDGLLRSFAVDITFRNNNVGGQLFNRLLALAQQRGVSTLHLLTETAENYFKRKGFTVESRDAVPRHISSTTEFSSICPSSAVYMQLQGISSRALIFSQDTQLMNKDSETGSRFWSVTGSNLQFTWFDVPPQKTFTKHKHVSEQITYVLEGSLFFRIGEQVYELGKGDSIAIPGNIEHEVWTRDAGAKAVDAWSPVNKKYEY